MRALLIGCVEFSLAALEKLVALGVDMVGVVTKAHSPFNADHVDLAGACARHAIPCRHDDGDQDRMADWIRARRADVVLCFGWSRLLGPAVLGSAPLGVVGYHPAELPRNRGRHPLIWALALGLARTGSTFFFMDQGADSGDILSQRVLPIAETDDARTLYDKMTATALDQIAEFWPRLCDKTYVRTPQDHALANTWRKRGAADGRIDPRMPARAVHNLVRALCRPYPGADAVFQGAMYKVWKAAPLNEHLPNIEPGKILHVREREIVVQCGLGSIRLLEHELPQSATPGEYLS